MIDNVRDDLADRADTVREELGALISLIRMAVFAAVAAAIYTELRKPPAERTWNGRVLNVIPYDFRIPTLERLREAYWNSSSPRLFTDRPLGVGWAINLPTLMRRLGIRGPVRRRR